MTSPVKIFSSFMEGAPQLTNAFGCMTAVLDAVLVNGFNIKSVTSITRAADIATVTIAAGHGYKQNQTVTISGAAEADYNGEFKILSAGPTTFTYTVAGTPATPATGTISCKASSLGWEIAFTGTNKRAYRSLNPLSNKPYLRVDDGQDPVWTGTYAKKAKVTMAQQMTGIDTFQGTYAPFDPQTPTKGEVGTGSGATAYDGWFKWYYARQGGSNMPDSGAPAAGNRPWFIVGDDRGFYLFNDSMDASGANVGGLGGKCFTDFVSYRAADGFNTILCAQDAYVNATLTPSSWPMSSSNGGSGPDGYAGSDQVAQFPRFGSTAGKLVLRAYTQFGAAQPVSFTGLKTYTTDAQPMVSGYRTGINFPNGPDYSLVLHPVLIKEGNNLRGHMPGIMWIYNDVSTVLVHGDLLTNVNGYPGRTFQVIGVAHGESATNYKAFMAVDITGPWW